MRRISASAGAGGDGPQQVALGDDSDHAHHVLEDDDRADVGGVHLLRRLADRVRRADREDVLHHHVRDRGHDAAYRSNRDIRRSLSTRPPVWHCGQ